jgi:lipoate-protein ligase A
MGDLVLRMITDPPRPPAFNMAADLCLLRNCAQDPRTVYVRFYSWEPPTVSIGWMQNAATVLDMEAMAHDGVAWIRRPTGGRAVLHKGDVTYSVVFPKTVRAMGTTVHQTYSVIAGCLVNGLTRAGITVSLHDAKLDTAAARREGKLPCFLAPNRNEIMLRSHKLIGSAQKRTAGAVLQHGSIPVDGAFRDLSLYGNVSDRQRRVHRELLSARCTCLQEAAPGCTRKHVVSYLADGFADSLALPRLDQPWTDEEMRQIRELSQDGEFRRMYAAERVGQRGNASTGVMGCWGDGVLE